MAQKRNRINKDLSIKKKGPRKSSVEFKFFAPDAKDVYLIGEFNNWDIHSLPMNRENETDWKAKIELIPGRYEYKYFVDGAWIGDVPGAEKVPNPFGTQNLVIYVE